MAPEQTNYTKTQRNLLRSVVKGDKSRVEELLKESQWSPDELGKILWHALRLGSFEAAHMLIEAGADVNTPNAYSQDGYHNHINTLASLVHNNKSGSYDFALMMMEQMADVIVRLQMADCLLHCAIVDSSISIDVIEKLVAFRATISNSIFHCHIDEIIRADVIEKLIDLGVRVKPAITNIIFDRPDATTIIPMLLQRDLLDEETDSQQAAKMLFCCIKLAKKEQVLIYVKMILDMKFPVCDLDTSSNLCFAMQRDHPELVQLLIEYGFNVNKSGSDQVLPLYRAAGFQESTITKLLIEAGAQVNAISTVVNRNAGCAIHNACREGSAENIQVLLRHGAAIDLVDEWGCTPFSRIPLIFHDGKMDEAHRIFIRHLAVLVSKNKSIQNSDLLIIQEHLIMHTYYKQCIIDLETMKTCKIINDISFFSIFQEDIKELLFVTRKYNFLENVLCEDEFPIFYEEMDLSLKIAKKRKELLRDKEEALYDSLKNILPDVPLQKIICYLYFNTVEIPKNC